MRPRGERRTLRVVESLYQVLPTTNPYLTQLVRALDQHEDIELRLFSFRRVILGKYDVLHMHWPEITFGGHHAAGRVLRRILTTLLLARLALTRTPIVRTWHNTTRPTDITRWDRALLDAIDRRTAVAIRLNDHTDVPLPIAVTTIPHGHYRDWFEDVPRDPDRRPRRALYFGLLRPYKGVEQLLDILDDSPDLAVDLRVVGAPVDRPIAERLRRTEVRDPRLTCQLSYVDDDTLAAEVAAAELVVLPYRSMHNSGAVLLALSLDTPVLVPSNPVIRSLAEEVGHGWVHTYDDTLTADGLDAVLSLVSRGRPSTPPNLEARGWGHAAQLHHQAFRAAIRA